MKLNLKKWKCSHCRYENSTNFRECEPKTVPCSWCGRKYEVDPPDADIETEWTAARVRKSLPDITVKHYGATITMQTIGRKLPYAQLVSYSNPSIKIECSWKAIARALNECRPLLAE